VSSAGLVELLLFWRVCAIAVLLASGPAVATEFQAPRIVLSKVDWEAAAQSIGSGAGSTPADDFAALNKLLGPRFPGIEKSTVPVLLPVDIAALRKAGDKADIATSNRYFGDFTPSKFFLAGPAGYDVTFWIDPAEAGLKFSYKKPIEVELGGAAYVYDLDPPDHQQVFRGPKDLAEKFPGLQRILRENHVRYAFERFGIPYVVDIQCYDRKPSRKYLACREAEQVAERFLARLQTAGGTPAAIPQPQFDLSRPEKQSEDFTYYPPGDLIENSGWKKKPGRADYNVYAHIRFPIANAPAYVKSQSFMPWGDCYRTGHTGRLGRKDAKYTCKVNGLPLVFNEAAAVNWTYPWRDNFCEMRDFLVGQCPGGYGHQGEDIRPSNCVLQNENADRCEPYQHTVAAAHDGLIWRAPGNLAAYIAWNSANEHVRVRYLHMNPKMMDADGLVSGRVVSQGEIIGKVATWGDYENGTSYHLHFNVQVFTRVGWVWVNPYMTLVAAYERQIGARGKEIDTKAQAPEIPDKKPVILNPSIVGETSAKSEAAGKAAAKPALPKKRPHVRHKRRHKRQKTAGE
jgi:hypothetical protein